MQKSLFIKLSIIASLCFIFAIALSMLTGLVWDRQDNAESVLNQIAKQHVYPQQVIAPFIIIPKTITTDCSPQAVSNNTCSPSTTTYESILASQTQNTQQFNVSDDTYKRGIYNAISYNGTVNFDQKFSLESLNLNGVQPANSRSNSAPSSLTHNAEDSSNNAATVSNSQVADDVELPNYATFNTDSSPEYQYLPSNEKLALMHWDKASLIIPVSDLRGVKALPTVTINGEAFQARYPDTPILSGLSYIEVAIPQTYMSKSTLTITTDLPLSGLSHINTIPTGQNFKMTMASDWDTPYFFGQALPDPKNFNGEGFTATWQNQYLSLANNQNLRRCLGIPNQICRIDSDMSLDTSMQGDDYRDAYADLIEATNSDQAVSISASVKLNGFAVSFAKPNDIYRQTERTMKYALLLVLVTFGTFFLFEVIKSVRIHPIQYLMVGSALLVFYVLLLPLTEQIEFWQAYLIAAVACVGLIGWYTYYVLGSVKRAAVFTLLLSTLYGGFYGILTSEDLNLLLGAVFCFILLASVMYLTRKIDWYEVV